MEIVRELRQQGMIQGTDFEFSYVRSISDIEQISIPQHAIFAFNTDKYATFFALKYTT